jgi:glycerol uptake facilitator-like aquaporin
MRRAVVILTFLLGGSALMFAQSSGAGQTPPGVGTNTQQGGHTSTQDSQQNQRITGNMGTTTGSTYTGYAGAGGSATGTAQNPAAATGQQSQTSATTGARKNAKNKIKAPVAKTRPKGENADIKDRERRAIGPPK